MTDDTCLNNDSASKQQTSCHPAIHTAGRESSAACIEIPDLLGTPFSSHQLRMLTNPKAHVYGEERSQLILNSHGSPVSTSLGWDVFNSRGSGSSCQMWLQPTWGFFFGVFLPPSGLDKD